MTIAPNFGKLKIHFQVMRCPETKNLVSLLVTPLCCQRERAVSIALTVVATGQ